MELSAERVSDATPGIERPACELSIVMPCLNESETIAICIDRAQRFLRAYEIAGEIVIADNGSTDGSQELASAMGARVVPVGQRGYGAALLGGIEAARGRYVAIGDADASYDFMCLMPFVEELRAGHDLVMGNRFLGGIGRGAMPPLHRYVGNPVLSFLGRLFFGGRIGDFHCGLRAFSREAMLRLGLSSQGMEFASEMVVKAQLAGLKVIEVPTTLAPDRRSRAPHLRSWRDGWRHLKFLLTFAPKWLFLYPGAALIAAGLCGLLALLPSDQSIGTLRFGVHSLLFSATAMLIGFQLVSFGYLARLFGIRERYWPSGIWVERVQRWFSVERGCILGVLLLAAGIGTAAAAFGDWAGAGYGNMDAEQLMRLAIPAVLLCTLGTQTIFTAFFAGLLALPPRS